MYLYATDPRLRCQGYADRAQLPSEVGDLNLAAQLLRKDTGRQVVTIFNKTAVCADRIAKSPLQAVNGLPGSVCRSPFSKADGSANPF